VEKNRPRTISVGTPLTGWEASMITDSQTKIQSRAARWPPVRNMSRCSICSDLLVSPEASVLQSPGEVCYLWGRERCQGFVTKAKLA
jgi:hypothetical protein